MHLAFICDEYPPSPHGGIGSVTRELAEGLAAVGNEIVVAGVSVTEPVPAKVEEKLRGVRVVRLPRAPNWCPWRFRPWWERACLRSFLFLKHRLTPFDLVECPDYDGWLPGGPLPGIPLVVRIHGTNLLYDTELSRLPQLAEHKRERATLNRATHLVSVSKYAGQRTLELLGTPARKFTVLHNAVDTTFFKPGLERDPGLIVFVNSLTKRKGLVELFAALPLVFAKYTGSRIILIGADASGENLAQQLYEQLSTENRKRVTFAGHLPRETVLAHLQRAAVTVYPSLMETFGVAPVEAMSCARPVVFSKLGPGHEVIEDGVNGILCDPRNPKDIADCIIRALADPTAAEKLGKAARERVLKEFDKRDWIQRNIDFYNRCCASS